MSYRSDQVSLTNLRLRGGHGLPSLIAARFISRMATIWRACDLGSSRRLTSPHACRSPGDVRTCFGASVIRRFSTHRKPVTMQETRRGSSGIFGEGSEVLSGLALRPRKSTPQVSDQFAAAALARARWLQAARKAFISARSITIRVATPLYFFVPPVTVRLTAPWLTRP
jgi:hypothetical protein